MIAHLGVGLTYPLAGFWWSFFRVLEPGELEALQAKYARKGGK